MHENIVFCITKEGHFSIWIGGTDGEGCDFDITGSSYFPNSYHPIGWGGDCKMTQSLTKEETEDILGIIDEYLRNKKSC